MRLILLGAPGSGKGTQAEVLARKLSVPAISTGAILREAIAAQTEIGLKAREYTDSGRLVPDEVIVGIVRERIAQEDCAGGFILDGFPRTVAQAEALESLGVAIDAALSLEVPDAMIEQRMSGRRFCAGCGATYHTEYNPPKAADVCDACAGQLGRRADDEPETVRKRLAVYHELTEPLKGFYERKGVLKSLAAQDAIEAVTQRMLQALYDSH